MSQNIFFLFLGNHGSPWGKNTPRPASPAGAKHPRPHHSWGGSPWFPGPMGKIDSLDPCGGGGPLFLLAFWATSSLLDHSHSFPNHTPAPLQARQIICKLINHRLLSLSLSLIRVCMWKFSLGQKFHHALSVLLKERELTHRSVYEYNMCSAKVQLLN